MTKINTTYSPAATLAETVAVLEANARTPEERWALKILRQCHEEGHAWICSIPGAQVGVPSAVRSDSSSPMFEQKITKPRRALLLWARPELLATGEAMITNCGDGRCHRPACQESAGYTTKRSDAAKRRSAPVSSPACELAALAIECEKIASHAESVGFDLSRYETVSTRMRALGVPNPLDLTNGREAR